MFGVRTHHSTPNNSAIVLTVQFAEPETLALTTYTYKLQSVHKEQEIPTVIIRTNFSTKTMRTKQTICLEQIMHRQYTKKIKLTMQAQEICATKLPFQL